MTRLLHLAGLAVLISGCAAEAKRPRAAPLPADLSAWVSDSAPAVTRATPLARRAGDDEDGAPGARSARPRHIIPPVEREARPRARARVDVSFQGADMVSALQFLADAGHFNVIMGEGLSGKVSATLRGVDPYDALVSLAEANGAVVKYERRIVVINKK